MGAWCFVPIEEWTDALPGAGLELLTKTLQCIVQAQLAEAGCAAGHLGAFIGDLQREAIRLDQRHGMSGATPALAASITPAIDELAAKTEAQAGLLVLAGPCRQAAQLIAPQQSQEHILHRILRCVRITAEAMGMQAQLGIVPQIKRADLIIAENVACGLRVVHLRCLIPGWTVTHRWMLIL